MKVAVLLLAGLLAQEVSVAGRRARELIAGRVVDEAGAGLAGVGLTFSAVTITTAADGTFAAAVAPGHHPLRIVAPGLVLRGVTETARNRWLITMAVAAAPSTVHVEVETDPEPDARQRARMAFQGTKVTGLPRVSPTVADLQRERLGNAHPVARQPAGRFCVRTTDCQQGLVCCASNGDLTDDYRALHPDGVAGTCRPPASCPGARSHRRK